MSEVMRAVPRYISSDIKSFRAIDFLVILFFLSTAAGGVYLFYISLYQQLTSTLEPVGTVTVKYNSIQRRQGDRVLWDRLRNTSPLYPGDIVRVAELSGAVLDFNNNQIELNENTLIRVRVSADGSPQIELTSGNLNLDTGTDGGNISLVIGGKTVEAVAGTRLSVAAIDDGMALSVSEGTALLIDETGQITEADTGTVIALAADGTELEEVPAEVFMPMPSERFEIAEAELPEMEITFTQIALDSDSVISVSLVTENREQLIESNEQLIEPQPIIVEIPLLLAPRLTQPSSGFTINPEIFAQMNNVITFRWSPVAEANAYIFTLFHQTARGRRQVTQIGPQTATSWTLRDLRLLDRGTFIWQVEAVYRSGNTIERRGNTAESRFIMNIPAATGVQPQTSGTLYGN